MVKPESTARSRRIYAQGSDPSIRVPMREVSLTNGERHVLYDTSGPFADPALEPDVRAGIAPLRSQWLRRRDDTCELDRPSSLYRIAREAMPELAAIRFRSNRRPLRAKPGVNVTQMHYARRGIITPEMEFVAIRENQRLDALPDRCTWLAPDARGRVVLVTGEAGNGKTTLVDAWLQRRATDVTALRGACDGSATPRPLGPFLDALQRAKDRPPIG